MKTLLYRFLQWQKECFANEIGIPLPQGIREVEKREYLTRTGIKNWTELSFEDKLALNIKI